MATKTKEITRPEQINPGEHGGHVSQLQSLLKNYGLYTGSIDGIYGPKTTKAVAALQNFIGQEPSGVADSEVYGAIDHLSTDPMNAILSDPLIHNLIATDPRVAETFKKVQASGGAPKAMIVAAKNMNDRAVASTGRGNSGEFIITGSPDDNFWKEAEGEEDPSYQEALKMYKNDFNNKLEKQKGDYSAFLQNEEANLGQDTQALDENNANTGTLFGTARVQQRSNLAQKYNNEISGKERENTYNLTGLGNDLESRYGTDAANSADFNVPGAGTVNPLSLKYNNGTNRSAYKPAGGVYGSDNTQYQNNLKVRYNLLKNGSRGDLGSIPGGLSGGQY